MEKCHFVFEMSSIFKTAHILTVEYLKINRTVIEIDKTSKEINLITKYCAHNLLEQRVCVL